MQREVLHSIPKSESTAMMQQRTDVLEKVSLGWRGDDAVHPSLVVVVVYRDQREETSLAEFHPPSGHQSTHQGNDQSSAMHLDALTLLSVT